MRFFFLAVISLLISIQSLAADELSIFDVRKNLPLTDKDPVYKDYFVNGGKEDGLKPGMIIVVTRRTALYDAYQNKSPGELIVPVGRIKLIHVQRNISVARLYSLVTREKSPLLEYDFIMIGDRLDLSSAKMDGNQEGKSAEFISVPEPSVARVEPENNQTPLAPVSPSKVIELKAEPLPEPKKPTSAKNQDGRLDLASKVGEDSKKSEKPVQVLQ